MQPTHHHHAFTDYYKQHRPVLFHYEYVGCGLGTTNYLAVCTIDHAEPAASRWSRNWWRSLRRRSLRRV